jgi:hypothetical protein
VMGHGGFHTPDCRTRATATIVLGGAV